MNNDEIPLQVDIGGDCYPYLNLCNRRTYTYENALFLNPQHLQFCQNSTFWSNHTVTKQCRGNYPGFTTENSEGISIMFRVHLLFTSIFDIVHITTIGACAVWTGSRQKEQKGQSHLWVCNLEILSTTDSLKCKPWSKPFVTF